MTKETHDHLRASRVTGCPPLAGEPVKGLQCPIICHSCLPSTINVY